ncbi:MAG: DUF1365 domain-containing protein [Acidimicrobiia bacterium]|nr:DUF1365 domain-containing protein [Acidimicrobiia bacterium]
MKAGDTALCEGTVWHRRNRPTVNEFTYRISNVWIDPDRPDDLTDRHRLWSSTRMAPGRFRRSDYGLEPNGSLAEQVRTELAPVLGYRPAGPVRMLAQARRWGWLFNPITLFIAWHTDPETPVGAVAEVTNTPWKERSHYALELSKIDSQHWTSGFDKTLHVSPFLHEDFEYRLLITDREPELEIRLDVLGPDAQEPIVETVVRVTRSEPTSSALTRTLTRGAFSTRIVSFGIHAQAARLATKRVPFVPHPRKRSSPSSEQLQED